MQTTLLGIGIALILALVAALVGPHFVDWGQYRRAFEVQATRLVGAPVRINGRIDARLLPTPSIILRDVSAETGPEQRLKAGEVAVELALGSLMRGDWRASQLRLVRPEVALEIDGDGRLAWTGGTPRISPDALSVDRLTIEDGRATIASQPNAARYTTEGLWFQGDVRSLAGPYKGEGGFTAGGTQYGFRLATGRLGEDGIRVKLALDPDRALSVEADGMLRFERGVPAFDGALTLARPAATGAGISNDPWRAVARVNATPAGALFDHVELQYGPDERAVKLTGTAELKLGKAPSLQAVASARQIDVDRLLALPEATRRLPVAVARAFNDAFGEAARPPLPVRISLAADMVTLAGAGLQNVRGDLVNDGNGWDLQSLEFRAPGLADIRASGRLALGAGGFSFSGPASVDARDPQALLAWLEGREATPPARPAPLQAAGELTFGGEKIAIERLTAEVDRKRLQGRLVYTWPNASGPARLDAEIAAPELDFDGALAFARAALGGAKLDLPSDVTLRLDIGVATVAGIQAKGLKGKFKFDADGIVLDHVAVADLGGAAVELAGRIDGLADAPHGTVTADLDARTLDGIAAVVAKFAPTAVEAAQLAASRLTSAKLRATLTLEPHGRIAGSQNAKISITGRAGPTRLNFVAEASGILSDPAAAEIKLMTRLEAQNGAELASLVGLSSGIEVDRSAGALHMVAAGRLGGDVRLDGWLRLGGLNLAAKGTLRPTNNAQMGSLDVSLAASDVRLPDRLGRRGNVASVTLRTKLTIAADAITLDDLNGTVANSPLRGQLVIKAAQPPQVAGRLETDSVDALTLITAIAGAATEQKEATGVWSTDPFVAGAMADLSGQIELAAARATFGTGVQARQVRALLRLGPEAALENIEAEVAGGRLTGRVGLRHGADGLTTNVNLALANADVATLMPGETRPPVTGRVTLRVEAEGTGRSPAALAGALRGNGTVSLEQAQFAGLDPRAFEVATRAVDQGVALDTGKIKEAIIAGLDIARLIVPRVEGALAIDAGQIRWATLHAPADGAKLTMTGSVDLAQWLTDIRLILAGPGEATGRPDIYIALRGPLFAPARNVDVSALTGWLMLRAVEREARRLEALQPDRQDAPAASAEPAPSVPAPTAAVRTPPAEEPVAVPPVRPSTTPPPGPRSAAAPPRSVIEAAPDFPAPIEIRPGPGQGSPGAGNRKAGKSGAPPPKPQAGTPPPVMPQTIAPQPGPLPRPPADLGQTLGRSVLDVLSGPQR